MTTKKSTTVVLGDGREFKTLNDIAHMRKRVGIMLGGTGVGDADWRTFIDEGAEGSRLSIMTVPIIPAMLHSFREILDNCVDEYLKGGHCTQIEVRPTGRYSFSIKDNGRGIPPELFHVFMAARSGSNFGDDHISRGQNGVGAKAIRAVSALFRVTSRYNGKTFTQTMTVGPETREVLAKLAPDVQNHFEERFDEEKLKNQGINMAKLRRALAEDGCTIERVARADDPIDSKTGTLIEVTLNPFVFSESKKGEATKGGFLPAYSDSNVSPELLASLKDVPALPSTIMDAICRETALIFPRLKIIFHDSALSQTPKTPALEAGLQEAADLVVGDVKESGESAGNTGEAVVPQSSKLYSFPRGMLGLATSLGYPRYRMQTKAQHEGGKKTFECEAILMAGADGLNLSFVNGSSTKGGTHVDDLLTIIADEIRSSAREIKKIAKEIEVTRDDVRRATFLFVDIRMTAPSFSSQTKEILTDTWVKPYLKEMVQESVKKIIRSAPEIIDAIVAAAKSRHESKENKDTEKQLKKSGKVRPLKLVDANSSDRSSTLLFLAEGDSAAAGFRAVRDERTMGILPLKGVVMNCANMPFHKAIKNDEIGSIVQCAGLPLPGEAPPKDSSLYFSKIVILTDADVDGAHIRSLLLTFFCSYWPWLAGEGRLFRAIPPLFELLPAKYAELNEEDIPQGTGWPKFAVSEKERDEIIQKYPKEKLNVSRNKGLGEMSHAAWNYTLTSPDCLVRLVLDDKAMAVISKWSDKDAGAAALRREDLKAGIDQDKE